jgi:hypothetical protein
MKRKEVTHLVSEYRSQRPIGRVGESAIFAEVTDWVKEMVVGRRKRGRKDLTLEGTLEDVRQTRTASAILDNNLIIGV